MKEHIGNKIAELRRSKGINQKELASEIGVSQPSLIKFEKGGVDIIPIGVAVKLANTLGVSFNELFEIDFYSAERQKQIQEDLEQLRASLKEKNERLKEKDIKYDSLTSKFKKLQIEFAEEYIFLNFSELIKKDIKQNAPGTDLEKYFSIELSREELLSNLKRDIEYYFENNFLSSKSFLNRLFKTSGFIELMEYKSTTKEEFIKNCISFIRTFSNIDESEVEKYILQEVATKWNPIKYQRKLDKWKSIFDLMKILPDTSTESNSHSL